MTGYISYIIGIVIVFIVFLVLQIYLSMQKNKWFGLVIPILFLLLAAFAAFGLMIYTGDIAPILIAFILYSIPAIIHFIIYLACRAKVKEKNNNELEKMNIQDLD